MSQPLNAVELNAVDLNAVDLNAVERTALLTAAVRAVESAREDRLYADPYAAALAGETGRKLLAEVAGATFPPDRPRDLPSTPDYNAIRTRFFDEYLQRAAQEASMTQLVLAPAGLDSRAWRLDWPGHLRYFEVDRPAVLDWKRSHLADATARVDHRTVTADLTSADWEQRLLDAGYDPALPSTWLLEGLLYYLTEQDIDQLLERIRAITAPGSRIAADTVNAAALTTPQTRGLLDVFERWGCPWVFGTDEPEALFARHGFTVDAVQPGEPDADFGRWPDPVPPRDQHGAARVFFVHGRRR
ncbi:methyltransferase (TIGR00027 family) [Kitasatospora sp. MAP12-15]|uniref:SAM-dependent methyltransferase n=1 Tax=unclassified Kitasatospora TaxID=2633591 RepID=UPI0024752D8C|nr:SAM-dependent methyltransferase [Kitasatospora sp. MAP12-44]MDH6113613.1 methyltransferase (TIGR00027 family) [Kitasatospora sp. MAP12-44]